MAPSAFSKLHKLWHKGCFHSSWVHLSLRKLLTWALCWTGATQIHIFLYLTLFCTSPWHDTRLSFLLSFWRRHQQRMLSLLFLVMAKLASQNKSLILHLYQSQTLCTFPNTWHKDFCLERQLCHPRVMHCSTWTVCFTSTVYSVQSKHMHHKKMKIKHPLKKREEMLLFLNLDSQL